jgi:protein-tyrosine phosphatase
MDNRETSDTSMQRVLFVCLGNICRSPMAEGIFTHMARQAGAASAWVADSAGTGNWHRGEAPDGRAVETCARFGIDISGQRARQVVEADLRRFDWIFAMDGSNERTMRAFSGGPARIHRFLDFAGVPGDVPDPYTGDMRAFEDVFQRIEAAMPAVIARLATTPPA